MDSLKIFFSEIILSINVNEESVPSMVCLILDRAKNSNTINNDVSELMNVFSDNYVSGEFID